MQVIFVNFDRELTGRLITLGPIIATQRPIQPRDHLMLRLAFSAFILVAGFVLSGLPASAGAAEKGWTIDSGGHRTRQEHVAYCKETKRDCLADIGPTLPRRPNAANLCLISHDQCMRQ